MGSVFSIFVAVNDKSFKFQLVCIVGENVVN